MPTLPIFSFAHTLKRSLILWACILPPPSPLSLSFLSTPFAATIAVWSAETIQTTMCRVSPKMKKPKHAKFVLSLNLQTRRHDLLTNTPRCSAKYDVISVRFLNKILYIVYTHCKDNKMNGE